MTIEITVTGIGDVSLRCAALDNFRAAIKWSIINHHRVRSVKIYGPGAGVPAHPFHHSVRYENVTFVDGRMPAATYTEYTRCNFETDTNISCLQTFHFFKDCNFNGHDMTVDRIWYTNTFSIEGGSPRILNLTNALGRMPHLGSPSILRVRDYSEYMYPGEVDLGNQSAAKIELSSSEFGGFSIENHQNVHILYAYSLIARNCNIKNRTSEYNGNVPFVCDLKDCSIEVLRIDSNYWLFLGRVKCETLRMCFSYANCPWEANLAGFKDSGEGDNVTEHIYARNQEEVCYKS